MNDFLLEYLLEKLKVQTPKEVKIEIAFLDEYGEGKTSEDEIIQNLIFTCEEGLEYQN